TATGLPVVAHDCSTTQWIMEDLGVLVDTANQAAVSEGLSRALTMKSGGEVDARRELIGRRFSWSTVGREYCEFVWEICKQDREPRLAGGLARRVPVDRFDRDASGRGSQA